MTWDELIEKVRDNVNVDTYDLFIVANGHIYFSFDGVILFSKVLARVDRSEVIISKNRTPDQMYQIITALTETKESK